MTRYLSSALGAEQPLFGQSIMEVERATVRPAADIRLSSEITQHVRTKITQLGLDPDDTTGPELYGALMERLRQDEAQIREALGIATGASADSILSAAQKHLNKQAKVAPCFALKATVARKLLKKKAPKHAMKLLGYRSLDSMLKHESVECIYAATLIAESASWHRSFKAQYTSLQPADFEQRMMHIEYPQASRWRHASEQFVQSAKHNILAFKELGAVIILPFSTRLDGLTITSL